MADIKVPIAKPIIGEEEIKNVVEVLKSGMIAQGDVYKRQAFTLMWSLFLI